MAQTRDTAWFSLVEAERAFARASVETTMQDAFLAFLADDAILFRPGPVRGPEWMRANPAPAEVLLEWSPEFADLASAGDLGYTTGPWRSGRRGDPPSAHGRYVTVWMRTADQPWRVAIDAGIAHPDAAFPATTVEAPDRATSPPAIEPAVARESLLEAERAFAATAARNAADAYRAFSSPELRWLRNGAPPRTGADAIDAYSANLTPLRLTTTDARIARSADLGYTYGSYELHRAGETPERGTTLRIWRRDANGKWRIVVDLATPTPPR